MSNIDNDGFIINGLRADIMRKGIENKNLLSIKGSLYVGTGVLDSTTIDGQTINISTTNSLNPSVLDINKILIADSTQSLGLKYSKVVPNMMSSSYGEFDIKVSSAFIASTSETATDSTYATYAQGMNVSLNSKISSLEKKLINKSDYPSYPGRVDDNKVEFDGKIGGNTVCTVSVLFNDSSYYEVANTVLTFKFRGISGNSPAIGSFYRGAKSITFSDFLPYQIFTPVEDYEFYFYAPGWLEYRYDYDSFLSEEIKNKILIKGTISPSGTLVLTAVNEPASYANSFVLPFRRYNNDDEDETTFVFSFRRNLN